MTVNLGILKNLIVEHPIVQEGPTPLNDDVKTSLLNLEDEQLADSNGPSILDSSVWQQEKINQDLGLNVGNHLYIQMEQGSWALVNEEVLEDSGTIQIDAIQQQPYLTEGYYGTITPSSDIDSTFLKNTEATLTESLNNAEFYQ